MVKKIFNILFLILFLSLISFGQENKLVTSISFVGNKNISKTLLEDNMITTATNGMQRSIFSIEPTYFDNNVFNQDLENILRLYQQNGYLDAEIVSTEFEETEKKVEITITIEENNPVTVDSINYKIIQYQSEKQPSVDSLKIAMKKLNLTKGKKFSDTNLLKDEEEIFNYFYNNGYPYVVVSYDLDVNQKRNNVIINWNIDPGPICKFGKLTVSDFERSSEDAIRSKINFKNGDLFQGNKIAESQQQLYNLGIYYVATFRAVLGDNREQTNIPIELIIKEAPLFKTSFGIGYGRDEKFRASVNLRIVGPWGDPSRITVEAKHSALEALKLSLIYSHSDFLNTNSILRIKTSFRRQTEPAFEAERKGIETAVMRDLGKSFFASLLLDLERVNMDSNSISYENRGEGYLNDYTKTSTALGVNFNNTYPFFNPERGFSAGLIFTYSGLFPKSTYSFSNTIFEFRTYQKLTSSIIFAYKIILGSALSYNDNRYIPVEERYFSGGSNSIRGWGRSELGPMDTNNRPIGGKSLWENSVEARISITEKIGMAGFLDFGNVWIDSFEYKLAELRYSTGIGFRYSTPIGPIRIDVAIPLFEGVNNKMQFWFSVGQAF